MMKRIIISVAVFTALQSNAQVVTNNPAPFNRWMGLWPLTGPPAITSVGFGNNFNGPLGLPESRVQINDFNWPLPSSNPSMAGKMFRTDGNGSTLNQWQLYTGGAGNGTTEKFKLFVDAGSKHVGQQSTQGEMFFNTATTNPLAPVSPTLPGSFKVAERMRLSYGIGGDLAGGFNRQGVTKVLISHDGFGSGYLPPAVAMLNIGSSTPNPSAGNRPWMDIGTYYSMHTDNMYVGMKDGGSQNNVSSVISWGDDPAGTNSNNRLLYLFTGFGGLGEASTTDGLEVGRMWASANDGRMGIGGDPGNNKYFGNSDDPTNTLEVNAPGAYTANTVGSSGLRFTNLRAASTPQVNPSSNVLSVDANGDVILVPGGGATLTGNNGISVTAGVAQLGVPCTVGGFPNLGGIVASQLTTDRVFANRNQNFWIASLDSETGGVGIGGQPVMPFCGTGNTFEVSANSKNTKYGSNHASGMRFTKLTSASPTIPNGTNGVNNSKVLTVDSAGDVVLTDVSISTGATIGNTCGAGTTNPLANNWEVPLNSHNYIFSETAAGSGKVGIGNIATACTPGNVLEVAKNSATPSAAGTSGLRLTDLRSGAGAATANGRVLSVNSNGDVILVPDQGTFPGAQNGVNNSVTAINPNGKAQLGQDIGEAGDPGKLLNDREIPFFSKTIYMNNFARVVMNRPVGGPKEATLEIGQHNNLQGYATIPNFGAVSLGLKVDMPNNLGNPNMGIYSVSNSLAGNIGVYGEGGNLSNNSCYGVIGVAYAGANNTANGAGDAAYFPTIGVQGIARGYFDGTRYSRNLGGYFVANMTANYNYAVWATAPPSANGTLNNWAGYFDGDVKILGNSYVNGDSYINGDLTVNGTITPPSDQMFKTNVDTIANPLSILKQLKPRTYFYDTTNTYGIRFSEKKQYGFIAQDVNAVLPELVKTVNKAADMDTLGNVIHPAVSYKTLNYNALFALLTSAMQKQQAKIDSLTHQLSSKDSAQNARLTALENAIAQCCSNANARTGNSIQNQLDVELSDKDAIVLNQNVPNPFAEQTTITYNVPESVSKAQLIFYNSAGQIIQTVDIKTRGKGKVNVFASDLSSGLYHYTLVADGKVVDSKKMVRE